MTITRPIIAGVTPARLLFVNNAYIASAANPRNCLVTDTRSHTCMYFLTCPAMKLHFTGQSSDNRVSSSEAAALNKVVKGLTLIDARCRCPACRQLLRLVAKV